MKIVEAPPKTGEEFIVAWFDDGEAKSKRLRYNKELQLFEMLSSEFGWMSFTGRFMKAMAKDSLIIIEG